MTRIRWLALAALPLLSLVPASGAETVTCAGDPMIIACFEAYETGLRSFHGEQLDAIVDRVEVSRQGKLPYDQITVIGHAAKFRSSDPTDENSRKRAETVVNALRARFAARGIHGVRIVQERLGISAPRATNGTREGRALNRRVEVFLDHRRSLRRRVNTLREVCSQRDLASEVETIEGKGIPCLDNAQAKKVCEGSLRLPSGSQLMGGACQPLVVRCVVCRKPRS